MSDTNFRYGARVGDDGRWHLKTNDLAEADEYARQLSIEGLLGKGQVVDFQTGRRDTWTNGIRRGRIER